MLHPGTDIQRRGNISTSRELQVRTGVGFSLSGLRLSLRCALVFRAGVPGVEADGDKSGIEAELN